MLRFCVARKSNAIVLAYSKIGKSEQVVVLMWTKSYCSGTEDWSTFIMAIFSIFEQNNALLQAN